MKKQKGFTLVELLVVIAIIGLLSTIAFISLNRARAKARDAKRVSDVRELQSALELYYNDQALPGYPMNNTPSVLTSAILPAQYVASIPTAPTPPDNPSGATDCTDATNPYFYSTYISQSDSGDCTGANCGWYRMRFCLGGASGGLTAGCVQAEPSGMANGSCTLTP